MILLNDFERFTPVVWGASDTETFTYINGVLKSEKSIKALARFHDIAWFRKATSVRVWAWQFSDGEHFFVTNDFDEYLSFLCEHKVKSVWFYNAKFDFAQIDYQLLSHNPIFTLNESKKGKKQPFTYHSLHNDKGARFSLKIWYPYKHKGKGSRRVSRHESTHAITFYDFNNIFGGGLKALLNEFNVVDFNGVAIRKTEMNYQAVDETKLKNDEIKYLENDTKGLYHLIRIADETLRNLTGYSITGAKPDVMTAGGLAKKVLLSFLYPDLSDNKERVKAFQREHKVSLNDDIFFRQNHLYNGGLCFLNEKYTGKLLTNVKMHRFDVNSEYPFIMHEMVDIYGRPEILKSTPKNEETGFIYIYELSYLSGELKDDKVKCFRNPFSGDYEDIISIDETLLMFSEEINELKNWYNLEYDVSRVFKYKARKIDGYKNFVETFYQLKNETKKSGEKAKNKFAKLLLNSSYGKLAERVVREKTKREISEDTGAVHLIKLLEPDINESGMLSVIQGAYITCKARIWLLSHIREICNEDVKNNFIYCDTDSVHTFCDYAKADAHALGAFKNEGTFNAIKYIAPKCYFDMNVNKRGKILEAEFHTKGLSLKTLLSEFCKDGKFKSLNYINKRFNYGEKFQPLSGMNVKGGKALIPLTKYLAKPIDDEFIKETAFGLMEL